MPHDSDRLAGYLGHLKARVRARQNKSRPRLPADLATFCTSQPQECLELILQALQAATAPELVQAIGNELLENLLNERSGVLHAEVAQHLRTNRRFRQAFACGNYSSVDPLLISEWVKILEELGTTKHAERKSLWVV